MRGGGNNVVVIVVVIIIIIGDTTIIHHRRCCRCRHQFMPLRSVSPTLFCPWFLGRAACGLA